ncbi:abasic site processing protein HMCES [Heptranchias perlo]|uniref:abasic site processing protein HMCES n=1 Tax=Heptranchias perlo TaxID=212740 RepID=UPI00355ACCF2
MCGRTACTLAADQLRRACAYRDRHGRRRDPQWRDGDQDKYQPSFNRSPHSNGPVLVSRRHFHKDAESAEPILAAMRWGLIPSWFRESDPSKMQYNTSNCRSDGMMQKKSYKDPLFRGQRCVVLADGFFEWQRQQGEKQPYFIHFPQTCEKEETDGEEWKGRRLLTMAGLFDCWRPPGGGEALYTYTIITVDASKAMNWIHDRLSQVWFLMVVYHAVCQEPTPTASSKMMMNWLQTSSPKKEETGAGRPVKVETPKKSSVGLMQMWLRKTEESPAKKLRTT